MNTWLLKGIFTFVPLVLTLCGMAIADDRHSCSNATLQGAYAYTNTGTTPNPDGTVIFSDEIGMMHFDGRGNLTASNFPANGTVDQGLIDFRTGQTGTYTVNADCTGRMQVDLNVPVPQGSSGEITLMFALSNHGHHIHAVVAERILPGATAPSPGSIRSDFEKLGSVRRDR